MRNANVWVNERWAGVLSEDAEGYHFRYLPAYLADAVMNWPPPTTY